MLAVYAVFALAAGNAGGLFVYGLLGARVRASSGLCWAPRGSQRRVAAAHRRGQRGLSVAGLKLLLLFLAPTACVCFARARAREARRWSRAPPPTPPSRARLGHALKRAKIRVHAPASETLAFERACAAGHAARVMRARDAHIDDEGATVEGGEPVSDAGERPATLRSMAMGSSAAARAHGDEARCRP